MPIIIRSDHPAKKELIQEGIFVMDDERACSQDIRALRVLLVNLMPDKVTTEIQLMRLLANSPLQVDLDLVKFETHKYKSESEEHLKKYANSLSEIKHKFYDAMIVTGAPLEHVEFQDVDYFDELCEVFEFSKTNVTSSLFICWGAIAALKHFYNIEKSLLETKKFGVFETTVDLTDDLFTGFDDVFYTPQSRYFSFDKKDIDKEKQLNVIMKGIDGDYYGLSNKDKSLLFISGHFEYDTDTLKTEYYRDLSKGKQIDVPINYFIDTENKKAVNRWRASSNLLFQNWINYYVYQITPYQFKLK